MWDLRTAYESALEDCIKTPEIASDLDELGIPADEVTTRLHARFGDIEARMAPELENYDRALSAQRHVTTEIDAAVLPPTNALKRVDQLKGWAALISLVSLVAVITVGALLIFTRTIPGWSIAIPAAIMVFAIVIYGITVRYHNAVQRAISTLRDELAEKNESTISAPDVIATVIEQRLGNLLLGEIRVVINSLLTPSNPRLFTVQRAPGLSEVFDTRYEVSTSAIRELERMLDNMRGGSIGIAGSRGVGKSTLIRSITSGLSPTNQLRRLAFSVSAPVNYDARDFVLHMYAELCARIVGPARVVREQSDDDSRRNALVRSQKLRGMSVAASGLLGVLVVALTWLLSNYLKSKHKPNSQDVIFAAAVGVCGVMIIVGIAIVYRSSMDRGISLRSEEFVRSFRLDESFLPLQDLSDSERHAIENLQRSTRIDLVDAQFQQTLTFGWNASLSVVGLSGGLEGQQTMVPIPKTFPELVNSFRTLLERLAAALPNREIVIGIDELDKIEDPERARQFINDIKGVFGVANCFFLVTVSVEALAAFGRRGIPVRDAFDSAFDEILEIENMSLNDARRILRKRTVGMSEPFVAIAYAMSGGLARDLIRVARHLVMVSNRRGLVELADLVQATVSQDLRTRVDAIQWSLRELSYGNHASLESEKIGHKIATWPFVDGQDFYGACEIAIYDLDHAIGELQGEEAIWRRELLMELAVLVYFAQSIVLWSHVMYAPEREQAVDEQTADQFARARALLAGGTDRAREAIVKARALM